MKLKTPLLQEVSHPIHPKKTNRLTFQKMLSASPTTKVSLLNAKLSWVVKYKELRMEVIRETFRDLTGQWNRNFVIYPISGQDDIEVMM